MVFIKVMLDKRIECCIFYFIDSVVSDCDEANTANHLCAPVISHTRDWYSLSRLCGIVRACAFSWIWFCSMFCEIFSISLLSSFVKKTQTFFSLTVLKFNSPFSIMSFIKYYLTMMCFFHLMIEKLPFFNKIALLLSWSITLFEDS